MMDSLRLILLLIGALFIAGIYVVYKSKQDADKLSFSQFSKFLKNLGQGFAFSRKQSDDFYELNDDGLDDEDIAQLSNIRVGHDEQELETDSFVGMSAHTDTAAGGDDLVVVFNIMARKGENFSGPQILNAMSTNGFIHGNMNIFHYFENEADKIPVCSIANAVEPGFFDLELIESVNTPGLSMFMQLPGAHEARQSFEIMLTQGRAVAEQLQGELCDESRSVLTMQTIGHIKEKIEAWLFKQKMAQVRNQRY